MSAPRRPLAVVTGASSGIGRAFAKALAADGYHVMAVARRKPLLDQLTAEIEQAGGLAQAFGADLTAEGAAASILARAEEIGPCELLVNNAGVGLIGRFSEADPARVQGMLSLNVLATTEMTRVFLVKMLERGRGTLINVASTAGLQPVPRFAPYAASKAYVLSLTEAVAEEVRGTGVRVVAVLPGATESEFASTAGLDPGPVKLAYMSAEDVARIAIEQGLHGGRDLVIPGAVNWATAIGAKILPRPAITRIAGWIYKQIDPKSDPKP